MKNMLDQTQVFAISEHSLRTRRRTMVVLATSVVVLSLFVSGSVMEFEFEKMVGLAPWVAIPLVLIPVMVVLPSLYVFRRLRQLKLYIGPDGLVRKAGATRQEMAWSDITRVRVRQNPRGEPRTVEIFTTGSRPLLLFGYESVAEVVRLVQARLPLTVQVETKRAWLDWENPFVMVAYIVAVAIVFEVVRRTAGLTVFENINLVIQLAFGIFFLAYGPISRTDPRFRKLEVILGVLILVLGLALVCSKVAELLWQVGSR